MKKAICLLLVVIMLVSGLVLLTGCDNNGGKKNANTVEVSYTNGKGVFTLSVPKNEDGTPKYQFTTEKPESTKMRATFYLVTDKACLAFGSSGLVYNTAVKYKEKYGDVKATFDGYLAWIDDADSGIKLNGLEKLEINGRKAVRYNMREGGSGDYKYFGYVYRIASDDIYPGSAVDFDLTLNKEGEKEPITIDEETQAIIDSLKIELVSNNK